MTHSAVRSITRQPTPGRGHRLEKPVGKDEQRKSNVITLDPEALLRFDPDKERPFVILPVSDEAKLRLRELGYFREDNKHSLDMSEGRQENGYLITQTVFKYFCDQKEAGHRFSFRSYRINQCGHAKPCRC